MKNKCKNIFDAIITSTIGIILMVASVVLWLTHVISLQWEGTIGIALGVLLLIAPKSFENLVGKAIRYIGGRGESDIPPNPPRPID